jgi:uncharacterized membrane protein
VVEGRGVVVAADFQEEATVAVGEQGLSRSVASLKKAIESFESKTSIEFVSHQVVRLSPYRKERLLLAFVVAIGLSLLHTAAPVFWISPAVELSLACLAGALVYTSMHWGFFLRLFLPDRIFHEKIETYSKLLFLEEELFKTTERNAILIVVAQAEHAVFVLADRGFESHVQDTYWPELGLKLAKNFSQKAPEQSFLEALKTIESQLILLFPAKPENSNELPDSL